MQNSFFYIKNALKWIIAIILLYLSFPMGLAFNIFIV